MQYAGASVRKRFDSAARWQRKKSAELEEQPYGLL
jgi:hypothetical protein